MWIIGPRVTVQEQLHGLEVHPDEKSTQANTQEPYWRKEINIEKEPETEGERTRIILNCKRRLRTKSRANERGY